jgi:hypothetical protein
MQCGLFGLCEPQYAVKSGFGRTLTGCRIVAWRAVAVAAAGCADALRAAALRSWTELPAAGPAEAVPAVRLIDIGMAAANEAVRTSAVGTRRRRGTPVDRCRPTDRFGLT